MKRKRLGRKSIVRILPQCILFIILCAITLATFRSLRRYFAYGLMPWESDLDILATGYCNCSKCCGWTTNSVGETIYNYGRMKGKKKIVGMTSTGTIARHGTIAADPRRFPMGTSLYIPGYGAGRVEDIGGAIKGNHIDLWFPTHEEAKRWGRRTFRITE